MIIAGGSATGSGINFQVAVTAIAAVHVAIGERMNWLDGIVNDTPTALAVETGGAGDDLAITFIDGSVAEIQIKRGLTRGSRLWPALMKLSAAIADNSIGHGVLIVCPDSSGTIRDELANDIQRLGDGQFEGLKDITVEFRRRLEKGGLPVQEVCKRLRIHTMNCLSVNAASIVGARAFLRHVCASADQITAAWDALYRDSARLVELRGLRTAESVLRVLRGAGISIHDYAAHATPLAVIEKLTAITLERNSGFSIFGIESLLPLDTSWIALQMIVQESQAIADDDLGKAVERYHNWDTRSRASDAKAIDPETIGRFVRQSVVCAGPGMGKSTYLKKIARIYARDGYAVLLVRLPLLAARMRQSGATFEEAVFAHALEGSGITAEAAGNSGIREWVLLCDGLDECGNEQRSICQGILNFVSCRPETRVVVSTRPIGYSSVLLKNWRHYELLPLNSTSSALNVKILLDGIGLTLEKMDATLEFAKKQLAQNKSSEVVSRSPLLMGFSVSLALSGIDFGQTKTQLFERLFKLIDASPNNRKTSVGQPSPVLVRFLDILGWVLVNYTTTLVHVAIEQCAKTIAVELELPSLKAEAVCDECLKHWEAVGIVERLRFANDEALTFVHKTFGEYAAARYLNKLEQSNRQFILESRGSDKNLSEVFTFASSLGLVEEVVSMILGRSESSENRYGATVRALELTNASEVPPSAATRAKVFDLAIEFIKSPKRRISTAMAEELLIACDRFQSEISVRAQPLVTHDYSWTRLGGLALLISCGVKISDRDLLIREFEKLEEHASASIGFRLAGGFDLSSTGQTLVEVVALYAIPEILFRSAVSNAETIVSDFLKVYDRYRNSGFASKVKALLAGTEFEHLTNCFTPETNYLAVMFGSDEYRSSRVSAERKILDSLDATFDGRGAAMLNPTEGKSSYLNFSAFLAASDYWRDDHRDWSDAFDTDAVQETWRALIKVTKLHQGELAVEVRQILVDLESDPTNKYRWGLNVRTNNVDIQVNWDCAREIDMNVALMERALGHNSSWVVVNAAQMLAHKLSRLDILSLIERIIANGKDEALMIAVPLAQHAAVEDKAAQLALSRLTKQPIASGSKYLFAFLEASNLSLTSDVMATLRNGLLYRPLTAKAAMKVADKLVKPQSTELDKLFIEAYQYWQKHEKPYPLQGGAIPDSPRAEILTARLRIGLVTPTELLATVGDVRSDVQAAATAAFMERVLTDESLRECFIAGIEDGGLDSRLLARAISQAIPFSENQCRRICQLMTHSKARTRFAAMNILSPSYVSNATIKSWANSLLHDSEEEIKEKARGLLALE